MPEPEPPKNSDDRRFVVRLCLVVALPLLLSASLFTCLLADHAHDRLEAQADLLGRAVADQLAMTLADHLVKEDILSLNVILSHLLARNNFDFASVYSADNRLLAQAGQRGASNDHIVFSRDVTFQNATVGYVQLGIDEDRLYSPPLLMASIGLLLHAGALLLTCLAIWRYRVPLRTWLDGQRPAVEQTEVPEESGDAFEINTGETEVTHVSVLVLRIRPARLIPDYRERIARALSLYGGVITDSEGNDITAMFSTQEQVFHAICGGLLVKSMIARAGPPLKFNGGIHNAAANDFSVAQKHASYLASIAENTLLTSRQVYEEVSGTDRILLQKFHSSLTPDGEVYSVVSLSATNQSLIDKQATQFV